MEPASQVSDQGLGRWPRAEVGQLLSPGLCTSLSTLFYMRVSLN